MLKISTSLRLRKGWWFLRGLTVTDLVAILSAVGSLFAFRFAAAPRWKLSLSPCIIGGRAAATAPVGHQQPRAAAGAKPEFIRSLHFRPWITVRHGEPASNIIAAVCSRCRLQRNLRIRHGQGLGVKFPGPTRQNR